MTLCVACCDSRNLIHNIHSFNHFAEYCVPKTASRFICMIQENIVREIDEELAARAVDYLRARHSQSTANVLELSCGFIFDWFKC